MQNMKWHIITTNNQCNTLRYILIFYRFAVRFIGTSFEAPCPLENELAKMVITTVPSVEMVIFTNSSTKAFMGMICLVCSHTNCEKFLKFEGCYHGQVHAFLVQAGSGVATLGLPDSPGVPDDATKATFCVEYKQP